MINKTGQWVELASEAYKLKLKRKIIEDKERELLDKLKILSQEQTCFGGGYLFAKEIRKGNVDYGLVPELKGVNLEVYRKDDVVYFKLSKV
jgi:hypothetical protein